MFPKTVERAQPSGSGFSALRLGNDNVAIRTFDNRAQFSLLGLRYLELVDGLLKVIHKCVPFLWRDVEVAMGVRHGASGIFLRAAGCPADHFGYQVLEAGGWHFVMRFINRRVRI